MITSLIAFLLLPIIELENFRNISTEQNKNPYWGELEHYHNFSRKRLYDLLIENKFDPISYSISERFRMCMEIIAVSK